MQTWIWEPTWTLREELAEVMKGKGGAQQSSRGVTGPTPKREEKTSAPDFLLPTSCFPQIQIPSVSFLWTPKASVTLSSAFLFSWAREVDDCSPPQHVQQGDPSAGSWARIPRLCSRLSRFCWAGPLLLGLAYSSRYPVIWQAHPHIPTECHQGLSGKRANEQWNVWWLFEARHSLLPAGVAPAWRNETERRHTD